MFLKFHSNLHLPTQNPKRASQAQDPGQGINMVQCRIQFEPCLEVNLIDHFLNGKWETPQGWFQTQ